MDWIDFDKDCIVVKADKSKADDLCSGS